MFFHWKDVPFIAIIALGIFLPEIYLHMRWPLRTLMSVRLLTLLATCLAATLIELLLTPGPDTDFGVIFTRAFIFIGVSRMIMLSSHQVAEHDTQIKKEENNG